MAKMVFSVISALSGVCRVGVFSLFSRTTFCFRVLSLFSAVFGVWVVSSFSVVSAFSSFSPLSGVFVFSSGFGCFRRFRVFSDSGCSTAYKSALLCLIGF